MHLRSFFLLALTVTKSSHLQLSNCGAGSRRPEFTDISVECGTASVSLAILICPVIYTGYNESLLILNHQSDPACKGTLDESVTPPVVRFNFPLNMTNACGSVFKTTSAVGTGIFSDFSNIQTMNISGVVRSHDPTMGMVTYNAELKYFYSCAYPLEYLINNTQVDVSASSIAVQDINGSFISSLSLDLFSDKSYSKPLVIPSLGIELRTNVYAQVQATNLTSQYYVLLDRCYASISASPTSATYFNLFVPCSMDPMTTILENGESHHACFFFPAFSFLEQQNQSISTYFLHCSTRLCEKSTCSTFKQCNNRKRRGVRAPQSTMEGVTDTHTISSSRIIIRTDSLPSKEEALSGSGESDSYVGLGVAVGVLAITCAIVIVMGAIFYRRLKHN